MYVVKRVLRLLRKVLLVLFCTSLVYVILLKWMPVPYTTTMLSRKIDAWSEGKDATIYYDWVAYDDLSDHVKLAVIASEDQRFSSHWGIDVGALKKAVKDNKKRQKQGRKARGASTISQQTAKNVFLYQNGGYMRKGLEVYFTFLIELIWGKERILEVYLNVAEMGPRTFGVQASSKRFYQRDASKISRQQAALLAAVLPNPNRFSARNPSSYTLTRSQQIQREMRNIGGVGYLRKMEE